MGRLQPDSVSVALFQPGPNDSTGIIVAVGRDRRAYLVGHARPGGPIPTAQTRALLAPLTLWVPSGPLLWVADAETGGLQAFDGQGNQVISDTLPLRRRPFDPREVERARAASIAGAANESQRAIAEAVHDPTVLPATMPLFDALVRVTTARSGSACFSSRPG